MEAPLPCSVHQEEQAVTMAAERSEEEFEFPYWIPLSRKYKLDAPFFLSGNAERELLAKQVALAAQEEIWDIQDMSDAEGQNLTCPIVGCGIRLNSLEAFEVHYNARHMASCSVCSRVYPTSRLLSIHVSETHDSFFQAKVARGYAMYECLVEGCGTKLKSYQSRQQHLVDKHKFPVSFQFFHKAHPSKRQRERQKRRQVNHPKDLNAGAKLDDDMVDDLVSGMRSLNTVDSSPSVFSFGHRHARGLTFVPRTAKR